MIRKLEQYHRWGLYLTLAIAFAAVAFGNTMSIVLGVIYPVIFVGSWYADRYSWTEQIPQWLGNVLILAAFTAEILQIVLRNEGYIAAGIRFVLILTAIKLWTRTSSRDDLQLYALSFMTIAVATTDNTEVTFGIAFGLYILAGTFSLALFHLLEEHRDRTTTALSDVIPFDRQYAVVLAALSAVVFSTSLVIFFGFPRIGLGFFAQSSRAGLNMGGFSESVELGSHGRIRNNPNIAMRVQFPEGRPSVEMETLHWRTIAFDHYDGKGWSRTRRHDHVHLRADDGVYDLQELYRFPLQPREDGLRSLEIYLEPLSTDLIPLPWPSSSVTFINSSDESVPGSPRAGRLEATAYDELKHTVPSDIGLGYTVTRAQRPDPEKLRDLDGPLPDDEFRQRYLQLPELSDRVKQLASSITADADTPYQKAEAIEQYLRTTYEYTTDLPDIDHADPVDSFLFETERGHCEYFSTAMVLLLRQAGVAARNVNGFLGGNWNGVGNYLAVRQGDAHSWVEIYVPEYGWVQMDPTPAGSREPIYGAYAQYLRNVYDSMRMQWMQWVIEYDLNTQIRLASQFFESFDTDTKSDDEASGDTTQDESDGGGIAIRHWFGGGGLVIFGLIAAGVRRDRRWWRPAARMLITTTGSVLWCSWIWGTDAWSITAAVAVPAAAGGARWIWSRFADRPSDLATRQFRRIERAAADIDMPRSPGEPPEAFLRRLADKHPAAASAIRAFRQRYLAARFGNHDIDHQQLHTITDSITQTLRSR